MIELDANLETIKAYCLENCILSGCRPASINATLHYLKYYKTDRHTNQDMLSKASGISAVALRNNVHRIQRSKEWDNIRIMLDNKNLEIK